MSGGVGTGVGFGGGAGVGEESFAQPRILTAWSCSVMAADSAFGASVANAGWVAARSAAGAVLAIRALTRSFIVYSQFIQAALRFGDYNFIDTRAAFSLEKTWRPFVQSSVRFASTASQSVTDVLGSFRNRCARNGPPLPRPFGACGTARDYLGRRSFSGECPAQAPPAPR